VDLDGFMRKIKVQIKKPKTRLSSRYLGYQACEVKMAGYWPGSFFCVFTDRDGVATQNLERGKYPNILTKQAWSIKDLF